MRTAPLLLLCARLGAAFPASQWITGSATGAARHLGLLPFGVDEALLPGETKQVHLYEARFLQLFSDAADKHSSCVGQMLIVGSGSVAAVVPLLAVDEWRKEEYGVWANLKCVGRVKLEDVEQTDYEYALGTVSLLQDEVVDGDRLDTLDDDVRQVHASVVGLGQRLKQGAAAEGGSVGDRQPFMGDDTDGRVEWGHELRDAELEEYTPLPELLTSRRSVLLSSGADAPPHATLCAAGLDTVWNVADEAEAERALLSFAACAPLSVKERARALTVPTTAERLQIAVEALGEKQKRLAALLALRDASLSSESS